MHLTWVGTATVLLEHDGFTLLTDPNFLHRGQRAWLGKGLWSRRLTEPALSVGDLPPLDAVVLSHAHGDHWDRVARAALDKDLPIVTTEQSARILKRQGFSQTVPLATWQSHELVKDRRVLRITSAPGRHAPGAAQAALPHVMGSLLEFADGLTTYITGDTLLIQELTEVPRRWPDIDLGIWHLGGTRVLGMLVTMDGRQGAELLDRVRPGTCVPIHYGDYGVFKDPVETFVREVERRGLPGLQLVERGRRIQVPGSAG